MKSRLFPAAVLVFTALSALPGEEGPDSGLFPLSLLLDAAVSGEPPWRPDWPAAIPPDSFALASGRAAALTLVLPAGYLNAVSGDSASGDSPSEDPGGAEAGTAKGETGAAAGAAGMAENEGAAGDGAGAADDEEGVVEYRLVRDASGRFVEFPFFVNGALYQATAEYEGFGTMEAKKITLDNPVAPDPWEFEFLEYRQGAPALARISHGGAWYFVAPEYLDTGTNETWYDAEGLAQGFFALKYRLQHGAGRLVSTDRRSDEDGIILIYDYNSAGRISGISAPEGEYAALYNAAARPRYWERPGASYALQWDEQGFLIRITGVLQDETAAGEPQGVDIRYEYTLDERGNWIERREISLARRFGRLVPDSEGMIRRRISYGDP
jgi:YD repeat-containing protein